MFMNSMREQTYQSNFGASNTFYAVLLVKPIDVSISAVGLILMDLWRFHSWGTDKQTDTMLGSSYGNMSAHQKFQLKAQH